MIACICQICQEIGFTDEAIRQFEPQASIQVFSPFHSSLQEDPIFAENYHYEIPSLMAKIFKDVSSNTYQLFSEGNFYLVIESCPDYWDGTGLGEMNENVSFQ